MNHAELTDLLSASPPELLVALQRSTRRGLNVMRVPPPMSLSTWAEAHFYLSAESSYVEGKWVCWPYQRAMLDVMGHDAVEVVTIRKSARVGYTKMFMAAVGYFAQHKRRNQVIYQPTDDDRDEFVTTELDPMLRDVAVMHSVFPKMHSRSKDNTMRLKKFLTGALHLRGGKAAKNYRRLTCDVVYYDELAGFDRDIEKEGAPTKLGDKRLEGSTFPKSIRGSTPKVRHNCNIEDSEATADAVFHYHITCPSCGDEHPLTWGGKTALHGFKWTNKDPDTVRHLCGSCGLLMSQAQYLDIWQHGRWIAPATGLWIDAAGDFRTPLGDRAAAPRHVAMPIWTAYSPQATWPSLVREYLEAHGLFKRGDSSLLKTFTNTSLGDSFEETGEAADEHELMKRRDAYTRGTVPVGGLVLTAGVDVQDNRFEVKVKAWGRGEESWLVDYQVLEANPADERDWLKLDAYLCSRFVQLHHGGKLGIEAVAIDTGGHFTHQVYNYVRHREYRRICGIKGSNRYGGPIKGLARKNDVNYRGQVFKNGVKVWEVGTDTAKDLIYGRLRIAQPGPGYMHFPADAPREYFEGLTAEQRIPVRTAGGEQSRWVKRRARNEPLDCEVYATWAEHLLDLNRYTAAMWQRLENAVQPPPDLFTAPAPAFDDAPALEPSPPAAAIAAVATQKPSKPRNAGREW